MSPCSWPVLWCEAVNSLIEKLSLLFLILAISEDCDIKISRSIYGFRINDRVIITSKTFQRPATHISLLLEDTRTVVYTKMLDKKHSLSRASFNRVLLLKYRKGFEKVPRPSPGESV